MFSIWQRERVVTRRVASRRNHREQRGGSHDADIGKRLQTVMPDLLQASEVSDQAKARLRGKGVRIPPSEP
jgi:hypothetical protein